MTARWLVGAALAAACTKAEPPSPVASAAAAPAPVPVAAAPSPPPPSLPIDARVAVPDAALAIDAGVAAASAAPAASYAAVLRSADWARWPGLPADLREKALLRDLGASAAKATRTRGKLGRHDVTIVDAGGVRYWLRDGDRVVLVELTQRLGAAAPSFLLSRFPVADREGAGRHRVSGTTTTEHVFAGRGIAITVAASYDQPPSFAPRLAAVQLFAASDLRTFDLELGGRDRGGPQR
jgi:hypothetical protein